jgi:hypothetical protein
MRIISENIISPTWMILVSSSVKTSLLVRILYPKMDDISWLFSSKYFLLAIYVWLIWFCPLYSILTSNILFISLFVIKDITLSENIIPPK